MTFRLGCIAVVAVACLGCGRAGKSTSAALAKPAVKVAPGPEAASLPESASLPEAVTSLTIAQELAANADRRRVKPAIIGGCDEACRTPAKAVGVLIDALSQAAPDARNAALRMLFDWSVLAVDGVEHGEHWATMWGDPKQHPARDAEIDAWLAGWSRWVQRVQTPDALVQMRMTGVTIKPIGGRDDVVAVRLRHPPLRPPTARDASAAVDDGEPIWRLEYTQRGYEWLIARIEHRPGKARERAAPSGTGAGRTL